MKEVFPTNQEKISIERSKFISEIVVDSLKIKNEEMERVDIDPEGIYTPKFSVLDLIGESKKK